MGLFSRKNNNVKADGPYNWINLLQNLTLCSAESYFDTFKSFSAEKIFEKMGEDNQRLDIYKFLFPNFENWQVRECFLPFINSDFSSPDHKNWNRVKNNQSEFISKFIKVTQKLGINLEIAELNDGSFMYYGPWQTQRGNAFVQYGIFYENEQGEQCLYWKTDALASDITTQDEDFNTGQFYINQPAFFQTAFFLAENPFPSSANLLNLGRQLAFSENFPSEDFPRPVLQYLNSGYYLRAKKGRVEEEASSFVTSIGYEISNKLSEENLTSALVVVMDTFAKIFDILEDGYLNYDLNQEVAEEENPIIPYEAVFGSAKKIWIPITLI